MKSKGWELPVLYLRTEECGLSSRLYRDEYGVALLEAEHWVLLVMIVKGHKKEEMSRIAKHKSWLRH